MGFSHRDRRAHREVRKLSALGGAALAALLAAVLWAPWPWLQLSALLGLVLTGAVFVWRAERVVDRYANDLTTGQAHGPTGGLLRAELGTIVHLDRPASTPLSRSPNSRRHPLPAHAFRENTTGRSEG